MVFIGCGLDQQHLDLFSIHPFSSAYPRSGCEATGPGEKPRHPSLQLLVGDPEGFPGQKGHIIPPASPGSALGPPPSRTCPENLQREATRRHPNQVPEPPQLTPFDAEEQRLYSELPPDGRAPHSITKTEPSYPPKETHFSCLYLRSCSLSNVKTVIKSLNYYNSRSDKELKTIWVLLVGIPIVDLTPSQAGPKLLPGHVSPSYNSLWLFSVLSSLVP